MAEKLVKILVQFLVLLAVVTKQVKQGRLSKSSLSGTPHHLKKIQGNSSRILSEVIVRSEQSAISWIG
jgi:hypothetical protein